jgi:hypothetical protein
MNIAVICISENQNIFSGGAGQEGQINAWARKVFCPSGKMSHDFRCPPRRHRGAVVRPARRPAISKAPTAFRGGEPIAIYMA